MSAAPAAAETAHHTAADTTAAAAAAAVVHVFECQTYFTQLFDVHHAPGSLGPSTSHPTVGVALFGPKVSDRLSSLCMYGTTVLCL